MPKSTVINNQNPIVHYKAYIAANEFSAAFDCAYGKSSQSALAQVKRQNSPDWIDCYCWCVAILQDGQQMPLF